VLTGLVIALIVLAAIYGYSALRPVPAIDADFGPEKTTFSVATPPGEAVRVVEGLPVSSKYKLGRADTQRMRIILQDQATFTSYGYFYPVDIAPQGSGSLLTVGVKPKYPLQFGPVVKRQREKALADIAAALSAKLAGTI
jgi:hypothetical protein